jgi:hypothetical protein
MMGVTSLHPSTSYKDLIRDADECFTAHVKSKAYKSERSPD